MTGETKDPASGAAAAPASQRRCPICNKPQEADYRPFCSKRCADVDLGRWLSGSYAIPVKEEEDEDGETPAAGELKPAGDDGRD